MFFLSHLVAWGACMALIYRDEFPGAPMGVLAGALLAVALWLAQYSGERR
jgi:hypothetical protein